MTNARVKLVDGIACMVSECRKELALVQATDRSAKYECKSCGTMQYELQGRDGTTRWCLGSDYNFVVGRVA